MRELDTKRHRKRSGYIVSLRQSDDGSWIVAWKSPRMSASSFWRYESEGQARAVFAYFGGTS